MPSRDAPQPESRGLGEIIREVEESCEFLECRGHRARDDMIAETQHHRQRIINHARALLAAAREREELDLDRQQLADVNEAVCDQRDSFRTRLREAEALLRKLRPYAKEMVDAFLAQKEPE